MSELITLSPGQSEVFEAFISNNIRFTTLAAGRRWGKNYIGIALLAHYACFKPGSTSGFVGKTRDSSKRTAFNPLVDFLRKQLGTTRDPEAKRAFIANSSELTIKFTNGSTILFKASTSAEDFRGEEIDGMFWCDEIDFHNAGSTNKFSENLREIYRPCTTMTEAPFFFTSTPFGEGMPFHDCWRRIENSPEENQRFHFTSYESPLISHAEIDSAKRDMTPRMFSQEYLAEFIGAGQRVYDHFGDGNIIKGGIEDKGAEIYVGMDFNVDFMCIPIFQRNGSDLEQFDEIVLTNTNSREAAMSITAKFRDRDITVYPDPSGKNRHTSQKFGMTDHAILREEGFTVISPSKAPLVMDRVNNSNNMIYAADGTRRYYIGDNCTTSLEARKYHQIDQKTRKPTKGVKNFDDINDPFDYAVWGMFSSELTGHGKATSSKDLNFYG